MMGTAQYSLSEEQQKKVLQILKEIGIDCEPTSRYIVDGKPFLDSEGKHPAHHCEVTIHVCSYDDESDEFNMYVQVE